MSRATVIVKRVRRTLPEPVANAPHEYRAWTPKECAERLGVSERTLYEYRLQGLPAIVLSDGRIVRYDPETTIRWFMSHERREDAPVPLRQVAS